MGCICIYATKTRNYKLSTYNAEAGVFDLKAGYKNAC